MCPAPPVDPHERIKEFYRSIAQLGSSCCCGANLPLEAAAGSFAMMQQVFGVFGFAATAELFDCEDVPLYYKILILAIVNVAIGLGSVQQWKKARNMYIPGVYTPDLKEPNGLPKAWGKISAVFEVLGVAAAGANLAQILTEPVSQKGMDCISRYFWSLNNAVPRLGGAIGALLLMGRQMYAYYHKDSVVKNPWLVSVGYTAGAYGATAFPIILELIGRLGNTAENIFWLTLGGLVQIPRTYMIAKQYQRRLTENEPLLSIQHSQSSAKQCHHCVKPLCGLLMAGAQTAFSARSMMSMVKTAVPDQENAQLILTIFVIMISIMAMLVPLGRYLVYA